MASVGAEVTSHHWGFAQGFDAYFDDMGSSRDEEQNRWRVERLATEVIDDALGWFSEREDRTKPFFAWLHMFDIHHPYEPPEPYKSQFKDRPYLGEIAWTDAQVQGFLDQLQAMGAMDNTWVFILSDHGEEEALTARACMARCCTTPPHGSPSSSSPRSVMAAASVWTSPPASSTSSRLS